ncbi:hypothetical protein HN51_046611 [Arachis hypogaea]
MPNSGIHNPLSVANDADVTSPERRNTTVNRTNTPGQGSQAGKEKFDAAREPTEALLATKITGEAVVDGDFNCGNGQQTSTVEVGCSSNGDGLEKRRTDVLRQRG